MSVAVVIPFRDRGRDPLRDANYRHVFQHWWNYPYSALTTADDGRSGDEQFNRSAAYNRGIRADPDAQVYVFAESDMLIDFDQVDRAVDLAHAAPGLVIPFTEYRYLGPGDSVHVRAGTGAPEAFRPQWTKAAAIGAVNVVSRATLEAVGQWDESFEGNWYDDDAMEIGFAVATGQRTRFVTGPAHHLYHLPGWTGRHLTGADRAATARNKARLELFRAAATPERIRELTAGGS
jgi:hypothetical protein